MIVKKNNFQSVWCMVKIVGRTVAFNIALSFIHFTLDMLTYVCKYTSSLYTY